MPGAMINRKIWSDSKRMQFSSSWNIYTITTLNESSPVNVGLAAVYNNTTQILDVTVEIYYTNNVTDQNNINVYITESGLIAEQKNGGVNYVHNHVFREALTSQWGNQITEPTTQGSLITKYFQFHDSTGMYDMNNCEVIAFITNDVDKEIISGNGTDVAVFTNINNSQTSNSFNSKVYPNPVKHNSVIEFYLENKKQVEIQILDLMGKLIFNKNLGDFKPGNHIIPLDKKEISLANGMYVLKLKTGSTSTYHKIIVE